MKDYGRFVGQYEVAFTALARLIEEANFIDRSGWPPHRSMHALVGYNLRQFHSALDQVVRGRVEESISLTRGRYETFVRLLFVSCHPENAYSVLVPNPPKDVVRFTLTNFLRHELRLEWETKYRVMSTFAHSNTLRVSLALQKAAARDGEPEVFGLRFEFNPAFIEAELPFLNFVILAHLRFAVERFAVGLASDIDVTLATEAIDLFTYGDVHHPKELLEAGPRRRRHR